MITYNHENFIAQGIEGVLMQKTNFSFELVIGEDFSTDSTRSICLKFANEYPDKVRLLQSGENYGMMRNFVRTYNECLGQYIAFCEGDDYWTDPYKLQKQVDFLESNPDYAICYHRVDVLDENGVFTKERINNSEYPITYTINDLAKGNIMHTPSVVFRNKLFNKLPDWFTESTVGDYVLHMLNASKGKIYYMPNIMAVYRVHSNSAWSSKKEKNMLAEWLKMLGFLLEEFKQNKIVLYILQDQYAENAIYLSRILFQENDIGESLIYLRKAINSSDKAATKLLYDLKEKEAEIEKLKKNYLFRFQKVINNPYLIISRIKKLFKAK